MAESYAHMSEFDRAELQTRTRTLGHSQLVDLMLEGLSEWFAVQTALRVVNGSTEPRYPRLEDIDRLVLTLLRSRDFAAPHESFTPHPAIRERVA